MLDAVSRLLFEDLMLLLVAEMIALAVVLAIHRRQMTPQSKRLVWVTLAVCGLLIGIQHLTVTRREALQQMIVELAEAVDAGDVAGIADRLDDGFTWKRLDKSAFVEQVRDRLRRWQIDEASVGGVRIEITGDRATVSCRGKCDWRSGEQVRHGVPSAWT